ncbi:HTH_38 domain-containing protein [Trichonephila clavipes]|nr:HTH_38 domain-containing protein [Trichonephila clavipes]
MTLIDDIETYRMPLRRNRRQYEQLTDFDSLIGLRETGWSNRRISCSVLATVDQEGRVYRRRGSGRPRNTNDREGSCNQKSGHFGTNNVASIDSTPLTSFQTSSAIKRNHKETTENWRSAKTLTTDPTS